MPIADSFRLAWTPLLKKIRGKTHQAIALICPTVLGSGGEFSLQIGREKRKAHTLDLIRYTGEVRGQDLPAEYLWMIPRPARPTRVTATWKTRSGTTHRASLIVKPAPEMRIHAIFKTHLDIGYTHRIADVIQLYQTRFMEKLLANLDATADRPADRRFVWTLSTWLLERCLDPQVVSADHLARFEKYVREGQVVWGLMPFTTHSEFFGLEEMNRSLYAARRLAERFDRPVPAAAKMTDVPAHTASLAMAFANAGGKFFQIGTNPESVMPHVPPLFWWKLPDGNQILCHYHGTYGTPLLPPENWPWNEWLAVQITSDNVGPQSLWTLDRIDWIGTHFDSPVIRTGRLEDFADAVIRRHGSQLPVVEKEFTDWWIHGIASMATQTAMARSDKERLPAVETLASLAQMAAKKIAANRQTTEKLIVTAEDALNSSNSFAFTTDSDGVGRVFAARESDAQGEAVAVSTMPMPPGHSAVRSSGGESEPTGNVLDADQVREAYEQLALYTEHTWGDHATDAGSDVIEGDRYESDALATDQPSPPVDRWIKSWRDKAAFAERAHVLVDGIEEAALRAFSDVAAIKKTTGSFSNPEDITDAASIEHTFVPAVGGSRSSLGIAVFNSLNWARGGAVKVSARDLPSGDFTLIDPTTETQVQYEREGDDIVLLSPTVPACGYLVLEVKDGAVPHQPGLAAEWQAGMLALHTWDSTFQFHKAGGIARWHDRARSTQWCSDQVEFPMGTYLYEMAGGEQLNEFAQRVHSNSHIETSGFFHRPGYQKLKRVGPVGGGSATVTPEINSLFARVRVEAECPDRKTPGRRSGDVERYRSTFTMFRNRRELHVRLELFGKRPTAAAESGYAFFPFSGEEPFILVNRIAHQLNPGQDLAEGVNAAHLALGRGLRIEHAHAGINFYPVHTPLVSFGEPGLYRFDEDGKHQNGVVYATLFNNGWGTNFARWQGGDFTFDFVLQPTGNDEWDGGLERGGAEAFRPLVASVVSGVVDEPARSLLSIEPSKYVQLVALKPAEWEPGYVLRLWNADVDPVEAKLQLPGLRRGAALWKCDLLERRKDRVRVRPDGVARLKLRPNEVATLLLHAM